MLWYRQGHWNTQVNVLIESTKLRAEVEHPYPLLLFSAICSSFVWDLNDSDWWRIDGTQSAKTYRPKFSSCPILSFADSSVIWEDLSREVRPWRLLSSRLNISIICLSDNFATHILQWLVQKLNHCKHHFKCVLHSRDRFAKDKPSVITIAQICVLWS